ncbi:dTDP-4-dehydrorhamnose 3,5-epimerase [Pseudorhodobacter sp. E13]|uniref:dTDP-4-dehydrorhamnose 3,5-epimerase n=1 Tax=Pseudorhodobacter sp. E13 TaxID=2487931 RepID=UPI000F8C71F2|nr:dTDP-4-dehydrorhamnose 3,5-epimerase [Pseudorhodobacter sp. E13]RUS64832.1 dTDP-4-dehydrorhamnose 3,5-epimerase [Pseudorhodobacter sp. E13]
MQIEQTPLAGLLLLTPRRFGDSRGFFAENWNRRSLEKAGVFLPEFVQDNYSLSHSAGTLRGLHYQAPPHAQGKLVRCGRGSLFDVVVDIRRGSPTYGHWVGYELSFENARQLWIPPGFLHGFVTRRYDSEILYKCTDYYAPECEGAVLWDSAGIDWGLETAPLLSEKDAGGVAFKDFESPFVWEA